MGKNFAFSKEQLHPWQSVQCFKDFSSLMMFSLTLLNFMFRNFFCEKQHYIVSYLNLGCLHHNFTGHKYRLSVYLQNTVCTEFVGKSMCAHVCVPWGRNLCSSVEIWPKWQKVVSLTKWNHWKKAMKIWSSY